MFRKVVKPIAIQLLSSPPVVGLRTRAIKRNSAVTILNLHRVAPFDKSSWPPLEPKLFEELLKFLMVRFHLTTFQDLEDAQASNKPTCVLSFDDGYRDFLIYAMPILEKFRIKVNQNIIPGCIESGMPPLNVIAQDFAGQAPHELLLKLDVPGFSPGLKNIDNRESFGRDLSSFLKSQTWERQVALKQHLLPQFENFLEFKYSEILSLAEVRQVNEVHEVGMHSYNHANLGIETDEFFQNDLDTCRAYSREKMGCESEIYAFPNGSYKEHQIGQTLSAGFKHVLLVGERFSFSNKFAHTRFNFSANSRQEVVFKALGGLAALNRSAKQN